LFTFRAREENRDQEDVSEKAALFRGPLLTAWVRAELLPACEGRFQPLEPSSLAKQDAKIVRHHLIVMIAEYREIPS
jgi:hypothetical protein